LLMAACAGIAMAAASSGSLDSSFGRGGRVFVSFSRFDTASGVAVQRGGGVVLVSGRVGGRISIVRFDRRGRLDRGFGSRGLVREPVGADPEEGPVRVALQPDGKIVFAGETGDLNSDRQLGDGAVAVYRRSAAAANRKSVSARRASSARPQWIEGGACTLRGPSSRTARSASSRAAARRSSNAARCVASCSMRALAGDDGVGGIVVFLEPETLPVYGLVDLGELPLRGGVSVPRTRSACKSMVLWRRLSLCTRAERLGESGQIARDRVEGRRADGEVPVGELVVSPAGARAGQLDADHGRALLHG
jgi:hypothetical protein